MVDISSVNLNRAIDCRIRVMFPGMEGQAFAFYDLAQNIDVLLQGGESLQDGGRNLRSVGEYRVLSTKEKERIPTAIVKSKEVLSRALEALTDLDATEAVKRLKAVADYVQSTDWHTQPAIPAGSGTMRETTQMAAQDIAKALMNDIVTTLGATNQGFSVVARAAGFSGLGRE